MTDFAAGYTAYDLDVQGRTLRAYRTGGDKPQVVLVHGYSDSALSMKSLIDTLAPTYDVIAYDSRGHGASARIDSPYTLFDLSDDLAGVIDALALDKPICIGHSMGAATVLIAAAFHPDHMRAIVAEDPPLSDAIAKTDFSEWKAGHLQSTALPREQLVELYRTQVFPNWSQVNYETRVDARYDLDPTVFDLMDWGAPPHWREWIPKIQCDGLLLVGNPELGSVAPRPLVQEVVEMWPTVELVTIDDVGHQIRCDKTDAYLAAILPFLAAHSG